MDANEFRAWMKRNVLTYRSASEELGLGERAMYYYANGVRTIPDVVAVAMAAVERPVYTLVRTEPDGEEPANYFAAQADARTMFAKQMHYYERVRLYRNNRLLLESSVHHARWPKDLVVLEGSLGYRVDEYKDGSFSLVEFNDTLERRLQGFRGAFEAWNWWATKINRVGINHKFSPMNAPHDVAESDITKVLRLSSNDTF